MLHRPWEWDLDQLTGIHLEIQDAVTRQPLSEPRLAAAYLARLAAVPEVIEQHVGDLRDGLASGRVAPMTSYDRVVTQLREFVALPTAATSFAQAVERLPETWPASDAAALRRGVADAIERSVRPGYASYLRFLETEYAGRARSEVGVASIPGGADAYAFVVRRHTTTTLLARAASTRSASRSSRRTRRRCSRSRGGEGHKGDLRAFLDEIGRDAALPARDARGRSSTATARSARGWTRELPEVFGTPPEAPVRGARRSRSGARRTRPAAYYYPPSVEDGTRRASSTRTRTTPRRGPPTTWRRSRSTRRCPATTSRSRSRRS